MKVAFPIVAVIAVFCSSCTKHGSEFDQLKGRIADSVDLVNQCHKKVTYVDLQNELLHDFRNQKDAGERRNLARVWAERVRGVTPSLSGADYAGFYHAVRRFNLSLGYSATALEEAEPDAKFRLSYYTEMLQRFKCACFAIPWSRRSKDETLEGRAGTDADWLSWRREDVLVEMARGGCTSDGRHPVGLRRHLVGVPVRPSREKPG